MEVPENPLLPMTNQAGSSCVQELEKVTNLESLWIIAAHLYNIQVQGIDTTDQLCTYHVEANLQAEVNDELTAQVNKLSMQFALERSMVEAKQCQNDEYGEQLNQALQCALMVEEENWLKELSNVKLQIALELVNVKCHQAKEMLKKYLLNPLVETPSTLNIVQKLNDKILNLKIKLKGEKLQCKTLTQIFMAWEKGLKEKIKKLKM